MSVMTVRNIPEAVHAALRVQARSHHRTAEAEVRAILEEAVGAENPIRLGDELSAIGRKAGLVNEDCDVFDRLRDKTQHEPMIFD